ncbi:hypothetical protein BDF19DRAFT_486519 [Syncephalis fuscata]|nr:hypothetical protein BDF19DRAFT_486519 [Syncephalis fuscata]
MSTHNNNTPPKIWQIVEIVHHILSLSEATAIIALARTCKVLYNSINRNSLWLQLYQRDFPRDINTDIDWSEWQLEQERGAKASKLTWFQRFNRFISINSNWQLKQEQKVDIAARDTENKPPPRFNWFQRYDQRMNTGLNWQKNKPTSAIYLKSFDDDLYLQLGMYRIMASYPGWFAIELFVKSKVNLIELLPKNKTKTYSLDVDKTNLKAIERVKFYQGQQVDDTDKGMRVILYLEYSGDNPKVFQIWNVINCQLLQSINFNGDWDGRIINASLLVFKARNPVTAQILYSNVSKSQVHDPQPISVSMIGHCDKFNIHTVNNNEMVILQYTVVEERIVYKVLRVLLTPDANLLVTDYDTLQMTEITAGCLELPDDASIQQVKVYSIDSDRLLFYCILYQVERNLDSYVESWKYGIIVISLSKGTIFKHFYVSSSHKCVILIPTHNLVVLYTKCSLPFTIISLLDGQIQRRISMRPLCDEFCQFQHLMDTKIINYNYKTNQYCIIDVVTGNINVYSFPIPNVLRCTSAFGHMLLMTNKIISITNFVPELN